MPSVAQKNGVYHVRFRFGGKQYKKSLRTGEGTEARAAQCLVETCLYRLTTGQLSLPVGVDPGDFIVSGGTLTTPRQPLASRPSLEKLVEGYLASQFKAASTLGTERVHLKNLLSHLGNKAQQSGDQITHQDLQGYLHARLRKRAGETVKKERMTILQLFSWAKSQGHVDDLPTSSLPAIKGGADRPPFRTIGEVTELLKRGGLDLTEQAALWECVYLSPTEIAELLAVVRSRAEEDYAPLLHAIPAYTGMRRGEILRLRWVDVDLDHDCLTARSHKQSRQQTETSRQIGLHGELKTELLSWRERRRRGQYVICRKGSTKPLDVHEANRAFWLPMRGTSWQLKGGKNWFKIGFHTYRHSFASNLAAAGVDQRLIDEFMGHTTDAMRRRYRHLFPKNRQSAIESFSLK